MIRIFVAIPIPEEISSELFQISMRNKEFKNIRWTPQENYHITLFFLGEVNENNLEKIREKIKGAVQIFSPLEIQFDKITFAGHQKKPSMVWAQFKKTDAFQSSSEKIYEAVKEFLLVVPAFKKSIPHITLARLKRGVEFSKLNLNFEDEIFVPPIINCELWHTTQTQNGVLYKSLEKFDFAK